MTPAFLPPKFASLGEDGLVPLRNIGGVVERKPHLPLHVVLVINRNSIPVARACASALQNGTPVLCGSISPPPPRPCYTHAYTAVNSFPRPGATPTAGMVSHWPAQAAGRPAGAAQLAPLARCVLVKVGLFRTAGHFCGHCHWGTQILLLPHSGTGIEYQRAYYR